MSLPEMLLAFFLLSLLMLALDRLLMLGIRTWRDQEKRGEAQSQAQVAMARISRELERSSPASVSVAPDGLAFLSALNDQGAFQMDAFGQPIWQRFVIYYRTAGALYRRELALPIPQSAPLTVESHTGAALTTLYAGGKELVQGAVLFEPTRPAGSERVEIRLATDRVRRASQAVMHLELRGSILPRN